MTTVLLKIFSDLAKEGRDVFYLENLPSQVSERHNFIHKVFKDETANTAELPIGIIDDPSSLTASDARQLISAALPGHLIVAAPESFLTFNEELFQQGGGALHLPKIRFRDTADDIIDESLWILRKIVQARTQTIKNPGFTFLSGDAEKIVCTYSEGDLKKLMNLVQLSCSEAFGRDGHSILARDVHTAARRLREINEKPKINENDPTTICERLYLRSIELKNIRGFRHLKLDLRAKSGMPRMQTTIIGRNGTCKTTLLRAIALAFADDQDGAALLSENNGLWVTEGVHQGVIKLYLEPVHGGPEVLRTVTLNANDHGERITLEGESFKKQLFLCAYGMGRGHASGESGRGYQTKDSVMTLFDYSRSLVDSELVLRRLFDFLGERRFDNVLHALKKSLGLGPDYNIEMPPGGGVEITGPDLGARVPLTGWADGYRMTFSWMIDFYGWAMRAGAIGDDGHIRGVLLVDEIEQHLHPSMQRHLLGKLAEALPYVQILATTHSHVVALTAKAHEIVSLQRDGAEVHAVEVPSLHGYSAEDILVEKSLFGTDPYAPETRERLDRHLALARIPPEERTEGQIAELQELVTELEPASLPLEDEDPIVARLDEIKSLLRETPQE